MEPGVGRDPAEGIEWHQTREPERRLLAQAMAEERGWAQPDAALASEVDAMPAEAVFDALCDVARRVDVNALALPRIGLLVPASLDEPRPATPSMRDRRGRSSRAGAARSSAGTSIRCRSPTCGGPWISGSRVRSEPGRAPMNANDVVSARLRARIFDAFPVEQPAFLRLLRLLDVEATTDVPTAAVTLGSRSRLSINPDFVRTMCPTDFDLVMLVLHELHHVALGHTRLFPRVTRAQNWAFDCVINAQLSRLYPRPEWTALFRRSYRADVFPEALLRPPEGWNTNGVRWLPGRAGAVHRALYTRRLGELCGPLRAAR